MIFVTKKEFEDALRVIQNACASQQLMYVLQEENKVVLSGISFGDDTLNVSDKQVTFIGPEQAIKNALFDIRKMIGAQKEQVLSSQKVLGVLEENEKKLADQLQLHKG